MLLGLIGLHHQLWSPLARGPVGVRPSSRVVHAFRRGCLPGAILVPLVIPIVVPARGHILLPFGLTRIDRRSIRLWSWWMSLHVCAWNPIFLPIIGGA